MREYLGGHHKPHLPTSLRKQPLHNAATQVALLREGKGGEIVQETRLWDEAKLVTTSMRKKEGLADYRYFPEPDLPSLEVSNELIQHVRDTMPETPAAKRVRYAALGLSKADVAVLTDELGTAKFFDDVVTLGVAPKLASNWVQGDIMAYCKEKKVTMDALAIKPSALAEMIGLIESGVISGSGTCAGGEDC